MSSECVYTRTECHHQGCKCSECPITELICDEFNDCLDLSYEAGMKQMSGISVAYSLLNEEKHKAYNKGYADGIDAFFKSLNRNNLIRNENDLIIASMVAEQLKEQNCDKQ